MTKWINRTLTFLPADITDLKKVTELMRSPSDSHTVRELIRKEAKKLKKETA